MSDIVNSIDNALQDPQMAAMPMPVRVVLGVARTEIAALRRSVEFLTLDRNRVTAALEELVTRCDGEDGVRPDGSNICTMQAHAALGHFEDEGDE